MDGNFDNIQELAYVESNIGNSNSRFYGEITQAMLSLADSPGSNNGTGLMQTLAAFAIRELYNKKTAAAKLAANKGNSCGCLRIELYSITLLLFILINLVR
eukprot:CCRYP_021030-RA/>CCRYP_021030-RA protein AED:0.54 eAED:0.37 QI:0/-1/0/1/-1/1/1/0/100